MAASARVIANVSATVATPANADGSRAANSLSPNTLNDPAIAQKFNSAIRLALDDPETRKKLAELGNTPRYETLEQFKATVKRDRAKWAEVVKAVGAKVD